MSTSKTALQSVLTFTGGDVGHQVPMQFEEDADQAGRNPSFNATPQRTVPEEVPLFPRPKKLTVRERLDRLSKHRIRPSSIRTNARPRASGGKAEVVRTTFKPNKSARGEQVAVKKLRFGDNTDQEKASKEFVNEVEILARLDHQNIVRLVGFVEDFKRDKAWIVLSWESNGSVRGFLKSREWEIPERISLIKDMFKGLEYLHSLQPPIRHGDLKSDNILVSSSYRAIITDFGSARPVRDTKHRIAGQDLGQVAEGVPPHPGRRTFPQAGSGVRIVASNTQLTLTGPAWSLRWAAPEVVNEEDHGCLSSDIWSAGWVCWEIMTDKLPFSELRSEAEIILEIVQGTRRLNSEHIRLPHVLRLWYLMMDCWKFDPKARPEANRCRAVVNRIPSILPVGDTPSRHKGSSIALLCELGSMHRRQGNFDTAVSLCHTALASGANCWGQACALMGLGDVHWDQSKYPEAEKFYVRARDIYTSMGANQAQAFTLLKLAKVHRVQSEYPVAEAFYAQALDIYIRRGDDRGRAHALCGLGILYGLQDKFSKAEEFYAQARDIYFCIQDDHGRAQALRGLGDVCHFHYKNSKAEELYAQLRDIFRTGDDLDRAQALLRLGDVCRSRSKYPEATAFHNQAREIYIRMGDERGRAHALSGLGDVYRLQSKNSEAEELYVQAGGIYRRFGDDHMLANVFCKLGDLHRVRCHLPEAERFYLQAQDIYIRSGNYRGRAYTSQNLGLVLSLQFRYVEAVAFLAEGRELYAQLGNRRAEDDASYYLAIVSELHRRLMIPRADQYPSCGML